MKHKQYRITVLLFIAIHITAVVMNVVSLDLCGDYVAPWAVLCSAAAYALFVFITEAEVFIKRDLSHLQLCLLFWGIHAGLLAAAFLLPDNAVTILLLIVTLPVTAPCWGILNTLTGNIQQFVFPTLCILETVQAAAAYYWYKRSKRLKTGMKKRPA